MSWSWRPKPAFRVVTWAEICALRSALRDRECGKRVDGSWRLKESLEETEHLESLLGKLRHNHHFLRK